MKIIRNKVMHSIWFVSLGSLTILYFFLPNVIEKNIDNMIVDHSKQMVQQLKLTRTYYVDNVVSDIKKDSNHSFRFSVSHQDSIKELPLPSTLIHDLGTIFMKETGIGFHTYSKFPFKNREHRVLNSHQNEVLEKINKTVDGVYISKLDQNNEPVLKIAIADYMKNDCVKCHNNHPDRTWSSDKWAEGDIRGVIEITTPLKKHILKVNKIKNIILISMGLLFFILIIYYSVLFLRREDELLKINDILDKRVKTEIEKNKEKEQILIQKSKLSSMGEMLNNISHQWRQPLNELSSTLMNIDLRYQNDSLNSEYMDKKMKKSELLLEYMSNTIDDFKNFFDANREKSNFNLKDLINKTLNILNINKNEDITITLELDENIEIYGYETELSQVLLNIITNAKDALKVKGNKSQSIKIKTYKENHSIYLTIEDNGVGISKKNIDKVFNLYFTSKTDGSGIGLFMSKLIIEKHFLGKIDVKSDKNGTVFSVIIPIV